MSKQFTNCQVKLETLEMRNMPAALIDMSATFVEGATEDRPVSIRVVPIAKEVEIDNMAVEDHQLVGWDTVAFEDGETSSARVLHSAFDEVFADAQWSYHGYLTISASDIANTDDAAMRPMKRGDEFVVLPDDRIRIIRLANSDCVIDGSNDIAEHGGITMTHEIEMGVWL